MSKSYKIYNSGKIQPKNFIEDEERTICVRKNMNKSLNKRWDEYPKKKSNFLQRHQSVPLIHSSTKFTSHRNSIGSLKMVQNTGENMDELINAFSSFEKGSAEAPKETQLSKVNSLIWSSEK
mmetsp:Transcript_16910/g.14834  ORF Transcript_16910/g.14834 Transcript_16910/m.14834 type:complete len:122 (-) Transcript_16910:326-691(-)